MTANLPAKIPLMQQAISVLWPSFATAIVATLCCLPRPFRRVYSSRHDRLCREAVIAPMNKSVRRWACPAFEMWRGPSVWPDWSGWGTIPAKAANCLAHLNRPRSPA